MPPYWPVVRDRVFGRVLPGLALSALGDGMSAVAIGWLALQCAPPGQRGLWIGLAIAAYTLPGAFGAVLLAPLLRGRSGAHLAALDAALRALLLGAVPVLAWTGALTIGRYTALLAGSALLSAWGSAGRYTLVVQVLPAELHVPANALLTLLNEAATVAGPVLAGPLIAWLGAPAVLAADAATFAVLAVSFALVGARAPLPRRERRSAGFAAIRKDRRLLALTSLSAGFFLLFGPLPVAMPLFASSAPEVALLYISFGVGAVIGAIAIGHLARLPLWPAAIGSVLAFGLLLLPLGLGLPRWAGLLTLALAGLAWAPFPTASMSLFQRLVPADRLPAVLAARGAVLVVATPLGTLLGAPLVQAAGPAATLVACGAATTVLGLVALVVRLRARLEPGGFSGDLVQHAEVSAEPPGVLPQRRDRLVDVLGEHVGQVDEHPAPVDGGVPAHLEVALAHPHVHAEVHGGPLVAQHDPDERERRLAGADPADAADELPVQRTLRPPVRRRGLLAEALEVLARLVESGEQRGGPTRSRVHGHPPAAR
nr:hypothetical protein GCM10020063_083760 [Dactylosporangium thailandense]